MFRRSRAVDVHVTLSRSAGGMRVAVDVRHVRVAIVSRRAAVLAASGASGSKPCQRWVDHCFATEKLMNPDLERL